VDRPTAELFFIFGQDLGIGTPRVTETVG
jgi:hypothetical protein